MGLRRMMVAIGPRSISAFCSGVILFQSTNGTMYCPEGALLKAARAAASSGSLPYSQRCQKGIAIQRMLLAMKTKTADRRIGSQSALRETISKTSIVAELTV